MNSGLISAVQRDEKQKNRYHIYIDDTWAFSVHQDILIKYNLFKGTVIDAGLYDEVLQAEERHKAYLSALRLLGIRPRTAQQLEQHLTRKGHTSEIAREVRTACERQGYIDDWEYARRWVAERMRNRPRGKYALKMELLQKGIGNDIVESVLSDLDQREELMAARRWLEKRLRRNPSPLTPQEEQKLLLALMRKGFSHAVVHAIRQELSSRGGCIPEGDE
ncbi:RecX family transcriptional regulator [Brevibacillus humidisoli]|uniref:RecX family transcriptional regulator n=1 Tax=Brevibacillus humidisoli TaxID=2895522 RepID=UPI001E358915|nr:RecX family transcriptional regulator [Brevibacillus humidisoli]UFJ42212.1 RecX family transcriptional regulator [Brevibacillus humidisoli]